MGRAQAQTFRYSDAGTFTPLPRDVAELVVISPRGPTFNLRLFLKGLGSQVF